MLNSYEVAVMLCNLEVSMDAVKEVIANIKRTEHMLRDAQKRSGMVSGDSKTEPLPISEYAANEDKEQ